MFGRTLALLGMNLQSLPARWGVAAVVVICLAGVSGVMVSMLAMAEGFEQTFVRAARADRVIVLTTGETFESGSSIGRDQLALLLQAPGLARLADGKPAASVERFTTSTLPLARSPGRDGNLVLRGVSKEVFAVRPEVRLAAGRMFTPGLRELVVGRSAQRQFDGLALGKEVSLSGVVWRVVGEFQSSGSALESEAWGEVEVVMNAYNQSGYSSVTALLDSPAAFATYKAAVTGNPLLSHTPLREADYYAAQGGTLSTAMRVIGYVVASIMGLGALFAAINTMYASIEARGVELATLRALGFDGPTLVVSVLIESVLLCGVGALLGGALAYLMFNGYTVSTISSGSFSQVSFAFSVSPALLLQGAIWAAVIGLAGGLLPALRAVRVPITEALRAT